MAQPTPYVVGTDFSNEEAVNTGGRSTVRTGRVDAELANIATTLDETLANLAIIQRDDTQLRDAIVELYHLSTACRLSLGTTINPMGLWVTATDYAVNDLVDYNGRSYLCAVAHTSAASFANNYATGKWQVFGSTTGNLSNIFPTGTNSIPNNTGTLVSFTTTGSSGEAGATLADDGLITNARIIVPSWATRVRITANIQWAANTTGVRTLNLLRNGAAEAGTFFLRANAASAGGNAVNATSAVLDVVPNDYFTVSVLQTSGGALDITAGNSSWICLEVVG
jgi:hypothetical protein